MGRRVYAEPDRRRLRRSAALAAAGDGVVAVSLPLLAAGLTRDPLLVAGVTAAHHLPWVALAVLDTDRIGAADQRTVLGVASTLRAATVALVGLFALAGAETLPMVGMAALALGLGEALAAGAEEVVSSGPAMTADLSHVGMVALVVGLPIGGLLFAAAAGAPFLVAIGLFAVAALAALMLHRRAGGREPPERDGSAAVARLASTSAAATAVAMVSSGASGAVLGVLVLFALDDLGLDPTSFALVLVAMAGAAALGGVVAPTLGQLLGLRMATAVTLVLAGVGYVGAGALADPASPLVAVLGLGVGAASAMAAAVLLRAVLHLGVPAVQREQAVAALHVKVWAATPVGVLAGGLVARTTSVSATVGAAGVVLALSALGASVLTAATSAPVLEKSG